ncbi:MAG TPA: hypothetical protein VI796_06910 [Candidatus Thermoplasmatota archaeon]|nr:hypothetical protein [Candidatus Thermoplasmatota archaeon]
MTENRFGHFGTPALLIAAAGVLALVLHLSVPYAHIDDSGSGDSETLDRGEAVDAHRDLRMVGPSSPGVTLAGTIILLVAGVGLLALGFVPMGTAAARFAGWGGGMVAAVGGLMAFTSSLYWVGSGLGFQIPVDSGGSFDPGPGFGPIPFPDSIGGLTGGLTGMMESAMGTDNLADVTIISPVLTTLCATVGILAAFTLCGNVVSLDGGRRERARSHLKAAKVSLVLLALVLLVPWSMGKMTDMSGEGDRDMFFFGAHTVLNADAISDGESFGSMAYAITVLTAAGWVGVLFGAFGSLGGVLASTGAPAPIARAFHYGVFATGFMTLWAAVMFVLAMIYMWKPFDGAEDFQPGWYNLAVLPALVVWGVLQFHLGRWLLTSRSEPGASKKRRTASFD